MDTYVRLRNRLIGGLYRKVLKPLFFMNDPEDVHDLMISVGAFLGEYKLTRFLTRIMFYYDNPILSQNVLGIHFAKPVGLAAGFDKDAQVTQIIPSVGFGFEEVGSITSSPSVGNPKPRLWRIPEAKSLVVWMGLKNRGAQDISTRLRDKTFSIPLGTSIAMTNCQENLDLDTAVADYAQGFSAFVEIGDYFTVNISCPNALGGQPFIVPSALEYLLLRIDEIETKKPVFVKLSPDMSLPEIDGLLAVVEKHRIHGIICTNLTKRREGIAPNTIPMVGGLSGKAVQGLSDKMIAHIYKTKGDRFVIVGCGGVFSAEDAYKKIRAGATLVQMFTGMVFQGPQVVSEIHQGLVHLLERDGFTHVSQAIGVDVV